MRVLIMGGSWFLGRTVAERALDQGWEVTTFTRGRTGHPVAGAEHVHGDRTTRADVERLATHGPWDAVIDTSSADFPPAVVLDGTRALGDVAQRYVYVSTVNAYRGWPNEPLTEESELLTAPADADADFGRLPEGWDGPDWYYGRQKAGAERAVLEVFGAQRSVILRPGVILGPGEYVGRLPWWLYRAERGGRILAPGSPERRIQPVDVRDVAAFALLQAQPGPGGAYNVVAPIGHATMGEFLSACLEVTDSDGRLVWAPDDVLVADGIRQWTELPLWRTSAGAWAVESTAAQRAGLECRPLSETVSATWEWLRRGGRPVAHPRWDKHGMHPEKERKLLALLGR